MQGWTDFVATDGVKLGLALLLGGCIGAEREASDKPAGLRTHMLICLGSTLMMILSIQVARFNGISPADPGRIAQGVITGIGFLGAGTILHSRGGVIGLTTAATTWAVAGIGLTLGGGLYGLAILSTLMTLAVLWIFGRLPIVHANGKGGHATLRVVTATPDPDLPGIAQMLGREGVTLLSLTSRRLREGRCLLLECDAPRDSLPRLVQLLSASPGVRSARSL